MCYEAESVVKHNWTDVAVHDKKIINKMRPGDTRLWIISELGSNFLPMYCKLYEKYSQDESDYELSVAEVHMMRFLKNDRLGEMQSKIARATSKFYFITKGLLSFHKSIPKHTHTYKVHTHTHQYEVCL